MCREPLIFFADPATRSLSMVSFPKRSLVLKGRQLPPQMRGVILNSDHVSTVALVAHSGDDRGSCGPATRIGAARVRIPDLRGEEFKEAVGSALADGGDGSGAQA
jgi:hypothetical protein